eukprot:jgi/Botrbrau1/23674/Bobra.55_2s0055.1
MAFAGVAVAVATIFVCGQQSWAQRMPGFGGQMGPGLGGPFGRHGNLSVCCRHLCRFSVLPQTAVSFFHVTGVIRRRSRLVDNV